MIEDMEPNLLGVAKIESERRILVTEAGEPVPYEIGTIFVPENRRRPEGRRIGVGFARISAEPGAGALPTFHLAGGPGSSHLGSLDPRTDAQRMKLRELLPYRAVGEVVILDQRGFSRAGDVLEFAARAPGQPLDQPASLEASTRAFVAAAKAAVAAHPDKDLAGYTVLECADDVDDLRRALGYDRILLVGQSFGSQWSLAVMRRHPGIVARAMLSGLEPLDHAYDMPSHVFAALQRIAWDADRDPGLASYLPQGGLMGAVKAIGARFAEGPAEVSIPDDDGLVRTVVLGLGDFQRALLRPAASWPATILSIYHRRYEAWGAEVLRERLAGQALSPLIGPLIDTSLGVTPARRHQLLTDPVGEVLGWWDFDAYLASSEVWPSSDVGDGFRAPLVDRTPVVFVGGDWDTATPIENMLGALPYFPNGRAIIVHRGPHAARALLAEAKSPVIDAVLAFLKTGDDAGLPVDAALPPPRFERPSFPPPVEGRP